MTQGSEARWQQRLENFARALAKLNEAVDYTRAHFYQNGRFDKDLMRPEDGIMIEGLIKRFEYTHELAWNVMKDFAVYQGELEIYGSRDATRYAFSVDLISDGQMWMDMIASRNLSVHSYDEDKAEALFKKITASYHEPFNQFLRKMRSIATS